MNTSDMSSIILEKAPLILAEIKKANNILLHCHISPDPDSICSALAMKFALEQLGKKATVIRGDSKSISLGFLNFPGVESIVGKSFGEVNLDEFDLFIILDSGSPDRISFKDKPIFPLSIKTINIDHHYSNELYADLNLVDVSVSTTYLLFKLFTLWNIDLTHDIALNLFIGIYTDTGGLKYPPIDYKVFQAVSVLTKIAPDFIKAISNMENSELKESIYFEALALNSIEVFLDNNIAIASVSLKQIQDNNIPIDSIHTDIPNKLKSVIGWNVGMILVERELGIVRLSMRSRDADKFDVSKLALALGGGGHRAAAGVRFNGLSLDEAKKLVVSKAKELYNL